MDIEGKYFIGLCIFAFTIIIVAILILKITSSKYKTKSKTLSEVDKELEKELKENK